MKRRKIWMILGSFTLILALSFLLAGGHAEAQAKKAVQPIKWIFATNPGPAAKLGGSSGDTVAISSNGNEVRGPVYVTPWIHPEAVFMLHGFGRTIPLQTRAFNQGMADQRLQKGLLDEFDPAGGGNCLTECVVRVRKV